MGSPHVLELEPLLTPISSQNPCGDNLRWDSVYDEIKQARRDESKDALDATEVQADWRLVADRATEVLTSRSKDLMIAGYLTEALVQMHGFAGLRDGLRLINRLFATFWERLYPSIEGDDLDPRAAPVVWFTEADRGARLPSRVREIPLVPRSDDGAPCSWSFWKSRFVPPKGENEDDMSFAKRKGDAEARAKRFEDAVAATPLAHYVTLREDIVECRTEVSRLGALLDEKFGRNAPGTTALRQALEDCGVLVGRIFKDKGGVEAGASAAAAVAGEAATATNGEAPVSTGPIRTRADALARLSEVAAFFRQTEPHSPVSYLVVRAAAWGNMSFEQLLEDLVKDDTVRKQIGELLGFK